MRKLMTALFAMVLAAPMLAFAQSSQSQDQPANQQMQDQKNTQAQENQAASIDATGQTTMPRHNMIGMVSNGGQSFTSDNKTYVVENPKKLKRYDSQNVSIELKFDTERTPSTSSPLLRRSSRIASCVRRLIAASDTSSPAVAIRRQESLLPHPKSESAPLVCWLRAWVRFHHVQESPAV